MLLLLLGHFGILASSEAPLRHVWDLLLLKWMHAAYVEIIRMDPLHFADFRGFFSSYARTCGQLSATIYDLEALLQSDPIVQTHLIWNYLLDKILHSEAVATLQRCPKSINQ